MTIKAKAEAIRADAEQAAAIFMRHADNASNEASEAIADGLLRGTMIALMRQVGTARAYEIFQSHADVLDRALLDGQRPTKPQNACGND